MVAVVICSIIFEQATQNVFSNVVGAQSKHTGSPADGQTCSDGVGCHGGTATPLSGLISSSVPLSGYLPDSTYSITATLFSSGVVRFGFEISPQDLAGNLLGTLIITNPDSTHFCAGSDKYVTHTKNGSSFPDHTATWSFDWTAPAAGTGDVTFYGAFNYANNNTFSTGDTIHTSTLIIPEGITGIYAPVIASSLNVYPNPVTDQFAITFYLQKAEWIELNLLAANGAAIGTLFSGRKDAGKQFLSAGIEGGVSPGIYFLQLRAGDNTNLKKVVKL